MIRRLVTLLAAAVLTTVTWVPGAHAVNLTGTWAGQQSCTSFGGSTLSFKLKPSVMLITQTGSTMVVRVDGVNGYNGFAIDDTKKPDDKGQVSFIGCSTDNVPGSPDAGQILIAKVKVNAVKQTGSLRGISTFESSANVGTCKWTYKRSNTADPSAVVCP